LFEYYAENVDSLRDIW